MKVVTSGEMHLLDKRAIEEFHIPALILMENAGLGVIQEMILRYGPLTGKKITVVAGRGNNGGDGLVIARHLYQKGVRVLVLLLGQRDRVAGDAKVNLSIYEKIGGELQQITDSGTFEQNRERIRSEFNQSDLIVDAIFGTGLTGTRPDSFGEVIFKVISLINEAGKPVVAVDISSGVSSDNGEIMEMAVKADLTVTFGLPKRGHYLYPGAAFRGELKVVDIGIPAAIVRDLPCPLNLILPEDIRRNLPERPADAHKGTYGHVLVIAGSVGKTGAAAMAALSALRTGAGLVTLGTPASLNSIMEQKLTEVMTVPLPETPAQTLSLAAEKEILDMVSGKSVLILGPGLSTHPETQELIRRLLGVIRIPIILDADGINALVGHADLLAKLNSKLLLTPHPGEIARLLGITVQKVQKDRLGTAQSFAQKHKAWLILKGAHSVVAEPEGGLLINPTGNEGMATGGTGDVLSGMLGGLVSQGLDLFRAAKVGVYLHGLAGDLSASQKGSMAMIAGDMIECIPLAVRKIRDI